MKMLGNVSKLRVKNKAKNMELFCIDFLFYRSTTWFTIVHISKRFCCIYKSKQFFFLTADKSICQLEFVKSDFFNFKQIQNFEYQNQTNKNF